MKRAVVWQPVPGEMQQNVRLAKGNKRILGRTRDVERDPASIRCSRPVSRHAGPLYCDHLDTSLREFGESMTANKSPRAGDSYFHLVNGDFMVLPRSDDFERRNRSHKPCRGDAGILQLMHDFHFQIPR